MTTSVDTILGDEYEPYVRDGRVFLRKRHDAIGAARKQFDDCVRLAMEGRTYPDRLAVQKALAQNATACARLTQKHKS